MGTLAMRDIPRILKEIPLPALAENMVVNITGLNEAQVYDKLKAVLESWVGVPYFHVSAGPLRDWIAAKSRAARLRAWEPRAESNPYTPLPQELRKYDRAKKYNHNYVVHTPHGRFYFESEWEAEDFSKEYEKYTGHHIEFKDIEMIANPVPAEYENNPYPDKFSISIAIDDIKGMVQAGRVDAEIISYITHRYKIPLVDIKQYIYQARSGNQNYESNPWCERCGRPIRGPNIVCSDCDKRLKAEGFGRESNPRRTLEGYPSTWEWDERIVEEAMEYWNKMTPQERDECGFPGDPNKEFDDLPYKIQQRMFEHFEEQHDRREMNPVSFSRRTDLRGCLKCGWSKYYIASDGKKYCDDCGVPWNRKDYEDWLKTRKEANPREPPEIFIIKHGDGTYSVSVDGRYLCSNTLHLSTVRHVVRESMEDGKPMPDVYWDEHRNDWMPVRLLQLQIQTESNPFRSEAVMNLDEAVQLVGLLNTGINASYVHAYVSTLGGNERPSVLLTISLDRQIEWDNGILENSRYGKYHIGHDGVIEYISGPLRIRKTRFKNINEVVGKINNFIAIEKEYIIRPPGWGGEANPFRSEAQRRYLWKYQPKIAKEWTAKYGSKIVSRNEQNPTDVWVFTIENLIQRAEELAMDSLSQPKNIAVYRIKGAWSYLIQARDFIKEIVLSAGIKASLLEKIRKAEEKIMDVERVREGVI